MTQAQVPPQRTLSRRQLQIASAVIALSFLFSGVLGLLRAAIIAAIFGAGVELDAFYAAYRLPELLFTLVAGGALGSAFIPVFSRFLGREDLDGAWRLASAVMTTVTFVALLLAILTSLLAPQITRSILIPEATAAQQALTVNLMRIMLWTVVIFAVSGLVMGILNAHQHFLTPALAPSMNNVGLILGAVLLAPQIGVYGLAVGAVIGAMLHLIIQLPALRRIEPRFRLAAPGITWTTSGLHEVLILMGPRLVGQGAVQLNFVVNTALASGMAVGSLTALTYAFSLMFVILGVVGQSVGTAIFPTLSLQSAKGDLESFRGTLVNAIRGMLFLAIPATVGLVLLASPLVEVIYQRGRWTPGDTAATAWALFFFAFGLPAFVLQEGLARAFFALRDTWTPVVVAVVGMLFNVALSLILIRVVRGEGPFGGLALANVLATTAESAALWLLLRRRIGGLQDREVISMAARTALAALVMGGAVWLTVRLLGNQRAFFILIAGTVVGMLVFEACAVALRLPEASTVPGMFLRRLRRGRA